MIRKNHRRGRNFFQFFQYFTIVRECLQPIIVILRPMFRTRPARTRGKFYIREKPLDRGVRTDFEEFLENPRVKTERGNASVSRLTQRDGY